jgi:hypothetical protein
VATRRRALRDVRSVVLARIGDSDGDVTGEVSALLSGLSSLLHVGLHVAFFPSDGNRRPDDADFSGCEFQIFGWTATEHGERVQLAVEAITGATAIAAPDGWAGRTELDALEVRATVTAFGTAGEWRALAVLEPADGSLCEEVFAALVAEVALTPQVKATVNGET